jgi:predicted outer membrane repeat protein
MSQAENLTLESCIFSGNQAGTYGGAVFTNGVLTVQGCTFYNNKVTGTGNNANGGAIHRSAGIVSLTGNLFSGNTATTAGNAVYGTSGITSYGYNVSDMADGLIPAYSAGNAATDSGYNSATGDVFGVTDIAFATGGDPTTKPSSSGSELRTLTPSLPALFPATYFDGTDRDLPATAGAVSAD